MKMLNIGVGTSKEKDPLHAVQEAIRQAKFSMQAKKIDLAIVFGSAEFSHPLILTAIRKILGPVSLIGASSMAVISGQGIFRHGLGIMLLSIPEGTYFNTACVKDIGSRSAPSVGKELGEKLIHNFKDIRRDLSIVFSDGLIPDGSGLVYGLQEILGKSFPLAGASASDNLVFKKTHIYFNEEASSDAACGIIWGGKLNFGLGIQHGWKPLGKMHRVTKSNNNVVYEIDGAPASQIYKDYLNCDLAGLRKELKYISIFYPIGMYLEGEKEYLLRNISSIGNDDSLTFQGDVPHGSSIRVMIGTKESCLQATEVAIKEAKKDLFGRPITCAFIFDSTSRHILLGRQVKRELEIIREGIGKDIPFLGLCTYGEQAPLKAVNYQGRSHFHNQTITVVCISN
ncbi:MAG: FIST N-terminal domain-containing protein [Candidatus Omnitrophica bacterium]|nr:FIST N-terminal domain-containing protein [Candidatus Omnitrophota bacterium]